jgi:hypothetical protein
LSFTPVGGFITIAAMTPSLTAGANTVEPGNPGACAPRFNEIIAG